VLQSLHQGYRGTGSFRLGGPGDHIQIIGGRVIRNGAHENGPYVEPCASDSSCTFPRVIVVPSGDYFALGDNRGASDDSRFWGPIKRSWIIGLITR
jgi:signal peptidase I